MKIAIVWKWWAWKTTLSVWLIKILSKQRKIIAIDADSNKNLIDYLWFSSYDEKLELWDLKSDIFDKTWVANSEYDRKYSPKDNNRIFRTNNSDDIYSKVAYIWNNNCDLIQLWEPRKARVWVTWMCPYNETIKVYLSNLDDLDNEIVWVDFAAWAEAVNKWIISSVDNIIIPLEPNSKNLDVAKDIYKTLKLINFKNVYFIVNKYKKSSDLDYIKKYFWEEINIIWFIPFSIDIMKMDIEWDINISLLDSEIVNSFNKIADNILKMKSDKKSVFDRLNNLDKLKWDKKCH